MPVRVMSTFKSAFEQESRKIACLLASKLCLVLRLWLAKLFLDQCQCLFAPKSYWHQFIGRKDLCPSGSDEWRFVQQRSLGSGSWQLEYKSGLVVLTFPLGVSFSFDVHEYLGCSST